MNNREISLLYALAYIASDAEFSMEREGLQVTESTAVLRDVQELIRGIIHLTEDIDRTRPQSQTPHCPVQRQRKAALE